ncbi:50S ribosomal protein L11 methyltransferase [Myxococcota bacterium]
MGDYFQQYAELEVQRRMVSDCWRTDSFASAIREVVATGDVVVDVGTGTGVLAMLAARAGARAVYAVDEAEVAQSAADLVSANGLHETVQVFYGAASQLQVEEAPDLIMSEWMGNLAFVEGMFDDVLLVRERLLKPGGRMLPAGIEVMLAPIDDPVLFSANGPGFWREPIHGLDLSNLEQLELKQGRAAQMRVEPASLLSPAAPIVTLDLSLAAPGEQWTNGEVEFEVQRDGVLNGFAGWFVAQLSRSVVLDTGPHRPVTHWAQTYLAFPPQMTKKGSRLDIAYRLMRHPDNPRNLELTIRVGRCEQRYIVE